MALNFPTSPTLNQVYTSGSYSWTWDGTTWKSNTSGLSGYSGYSGSFPSSPVITGTIVEDVYAIVDGGSVDIDPANGSIQTWTLGASRTPTATNFTSGQSVTLLINDGTAYTVTWSSISVTWVGGTAPTLPTTGYGVIVLWKVGTTVYGKSVGDVA